ncbi:hypothetical protein SDRG_00633 [Saprolegnia diclina VS20]|uniref:Uncharacterized protein n=1 Tax=Saprolegnia diclina (strain VS20) TaxID=1156394 RepID=T0R5S7_SAPDV|nr:hypothetical protein SDRG_00633 [Saprolegnia diclina VS20]EQC41770.1 hypothetical protein SDRG_00633 [Saprolegnia diclina VS20]|eukprot:XP_008604339.1 hypothetical protein SDRG_00633 [Saprolegnia diclina VS20]
MSSSQLLKLHSVLDDAYFEVRGRACSTVSGIATTFTVVKDPNLMDKMKLKSAASSKNKAELFVRIDVGTITITAQGATTDIAIAQGCTDVHLRGRRSVIVATRQGHDHTTLAFSDRLSAVEFCGCVGLIQHIEHLREPRYLAESLNHDASMLKYTRLTLAFAEEMWTLAMWRELWPYSNVLSALRSVLAALPDATNVQRVRAINATLAEVHDQFYGHAAINFFMEKDGVRYYRASYVALLVAKIKALQTHLAFYM